MMAELSRPEKETLNVSLGNICLADDCVRGWAYDSKKLCGKHYQRMMKYGDPNISFGRPENFLVPSLIESRISISNDDCWNWTGRVGKKGYGQIDVQGGAWQAHRASYWIFNGAFDVTLHVLHSCDNPPCVNPKHLFLGTNDDNVADKVSKGRHVFGARSFSAKFTDEDIYTLRKKSDLGESTVLLAKEFSVDYKTMWAIVNRKSWKHLEEK